MPVPPPVTMATLPASSVGSGVMARPYGSARLPCRASLGRMADVEIEDRGAVRIITINRPEVRNALNGAVLEGVGTTLMAVDADPGVRAVIVTAAGDRAFCAGADLK